MTVLFFFFCESNGIFSGETPPAEEGTVKSDEPAAGVEHDALCYSQVSDEPDATTAAGGGPSK